MQVLRVTRSRLHRVGCDAVRVWSRLAALHDDAGVSQFRGDQSGRRVPEPMRCACSSSSSAALDDPRVDAARYGPALGRAPIAASSLSLSKDELETVRPGLTTSEIHLWRRARS